MVGTTQIAHVYRIGIPAVDTAVVGTKDRMGKTDLPHAVQLCVRDGKCSAAALADACDLIIHRHKTLPLLKRVDKTDTYYTIFIGQNQK